MTNAEGEALQALILVDIQNDFLPGGALAVSAGNEVVAVANRLMDCFPLIVATQDWHPADHGSFASQHPGRQAGDVIQLDGIPQILWPDHCVQGTLGAEFAPGFAVERVQQIFHKGVDRDIDSYSGFFDNQRLRSTGLGEFLRERGATEIAIAGLATDYCVKLSVLDAIQLGFRVRVIQDGCRGVNLQPGDSARALQEMQDAGARMVSSLEVAW
jgi:nicotinamidase/pyrazinamidase